jgi:hypothetical protein
MHSHSEIAHSSHQPSLPAALSFYQLSFDCHQPKGSLTQAVRIQLLWSTHLYCLWTMRWIITSSPHLLLDTWRCVSTSGKDLRNPENKKNQKPLTKMSAYNTGNTSFWNIWDPLNPMFHWLSQHKLKASQLSRDTNLGKPWGFMIRSGQIPLSEKGKSSCCTIVPHTPFWPCLLLNLSPTCPSKDIRHQ